MRKSKGFLLVHDVIIFMLCSLLLLSVADVWKTCIIRRQQYYRLTQAVNTMENYLLGKSFADGYYVTRSTVDMSVGKLVELRVWEDASCEQTLCNLFYFEEL